VIKSNELFYLVGILEMNGFLGSEPFSTTNEPKGSGVGNKLKDFQEF
jgi:hypothetical protein